MASPISDTSNVSDPVNVVLQERFLRRARAVIPYFAGTVPGEIVTHRGSDTAKWRRYDNISPSTSALSEQTGNLAVDARTADVPTITDVTATVARYGQHFIVNEEIDLINPTPQDAELTDVLAIAGGRSLGRLARNEMEDNATAIRAGGATADSAVVSKLTRNAVRNAVNTLERNSAMKFTGQTSGSTNINTTPIRPAFWGIAHHDVIEDVRDQGGFTPAEQYASQTRVELNEAGISNGVRWIGTEEAGVRANAGGALGATGLRSTGAANIDLYDAIIYGMEAVGTLSFDMPEHPKEVYTAGDQLPSMMLIRKAFGSSGVVDPYDELSSIAYKTWSAEKILNSAWIRRVVCGATDFNS